MHWPRWRRAPLRLSFSIAALCVAASAYADEIRLANGDRITGQIVRKVGNDLVVDTDYAGRLTLRWDQVSTLQTDQPLTVMTRDGELSDEAQLGSRSEVALDIGSAAGTRSVRPEDIAFINPTPEQSGRGATYRGHANVSASLVRGNSENERIYGDAGFNARARDYAWGLGVKVNRREERGIRTAQQLLVDGNYDRFIDPRHFLYGRSSLEQDRFKDIRLRTTVGAGYGWQLYDDDRTRLSLRTGLDYVTLDRRVGMDEDYPALGWGVRASRKVFARGAELFHDQDGFLSLSDPDFLTIRTRSGVRLPIAGGMTASAQLNADWERTPAPGRKPTDTTVLLGLGYVW